jgi:hypothetical protein
MAVINKPARIVSSQHLLSIDPSGPGKSPNPDGKTFRN